MVLTRATTGYHSVTNSNFNRCLLNSQKQYEGTIELGYETDTLDIEGEKVIISKNTIPETIDIKAIENHVLSLKEQFPPKFSAIKVNGTPMYKLARKKVDVKPKKREIKVLMKLCLIE